MTQRKLAKSSGHIPVFVNPTSLNFVVSDSDTHKQIFTIYNPYEFSICYQVLCNAAVRYVITNPVGTIKPNCLTDVMVRHTDPSSSNIHNINDKFRIEITEEGYRDVVGKKDIPVLLTDKEIATDTSADTEKFQSVKGSAKSSGAEKIGQLYTGQHYAAERNGSSWLIVIGALICLIALLLPTEGEGGNSSLPSCLHLHTNMKVAIGFALGLLTCTFIRSF